MRDLRLSIVGPLLVASLAASPALAQTDMVAMGHHAAANQLGVLEYCQGRGDVGADAVDAQKTVISRLPASTVSTDQDESTGRSGALSAPNGQTTSLSEVASKQGVSVSVLCKKLGDGVIQSSKASYGGGMTMPGMPSMPTMPAMPTMPH